MILSQTNKEFFDFIKQEFSYVWDCKGWIKAVSCQLPTYQHAEIKKSVLKVKSPASEGKYDASGASTFPATGDHFWIAVTAYSKNDANSLN